MHLHESLMFITWILFQDPLCFKMYKNTDKSWKFYKIIEIGYIWKKNCIFKNLESQNPEIITHEKRCLVMKHKRRSIWISEHCCGRQLSLSIWERQTQTFWVLSKSQSMRKTWQIIHSPLGVQHYNQMLTPTSPKMTPIILRLFLL